MHIFIIYRSSEKKYIKNNIRWAFDIFDINVEKRLLKYEKNVVQSFDNNTIISRNKEN